MKVQINYVEYYYSKYVLKQDSENDDKPLLEIHLTEIFNEPSSFLDEVWIVFKEDPSIFFVGELIDIRVQSFVNKNSSILIISPIRIVTNDGESL